MNTTTTHPLETSTVTSTPRALTRSLAGAVLTAVLAALVVFIGSPAHAADLTYPNKYPYTPAARHYAFTKNTAKGDYLFALQRRDVADVLFIDTAHSTPNGFYYAKRNIGRTANPTFTRPFSWVYQPYGMWCMVDGGKIERDPFLNVPTCQSLTPTPPWDETQNLGVTDPAMLAQARRSCRDVWQHPWTDPSPIGIAPGPVGPITDEGGCRARDFDLTYVAPQTWPGVVTECAPWEDRGLMRNGKPACTAITYPWANLPAGQADATAWTPQPDACVPVSRTWNDGKTDTTPILDRDYPAPTPDCTGVTPPPNCDTANPISAENPACGGTPTVSAPWFDPDIRRTVTATATFTLSDPAALTRTITKTGSAIAYGPKGTVKAVAKTKVRGKVVKAVVKEPFAAIANVDATVTITVTAPPQTATGAGSDYQNGDTETYSPTRSQIAAEDAALADAKAKAYQAAGRWLATEGSNQASAEANAKATAQAQAQASQTSPAAAKKAAYAKAMKKAKADLAKKVKKLKR